MPCFAAVQAGGESETSLPLGRGKASTVVFSGLLGNVGHSDWRRRLLTRRSGGASRRRNGARGIFAPLFLLPLNLLFGTSTQLRQVFGAHSRQWCATVGVNDLHLEFNTAGRLTALWVEGKIKVATAKTHAPSSCIIYSTEWTGCTSSNTQLHWYEGRVSCCHRLNPLRCVFAKEDATTVW